MTDESAERAGLENLHAMAPAEREALLFACCASKEWVRAVAIGLPSCASPDALVRLAEQAWWELDPGDWRVALNAHPKIGERPAEGSQEGREQRSMDTAGPAIREAIAEGNRAYEQRFGMTYVVRAAGRSPAEMLLLLRQRLDNDPDPELRIAAAQQAEITRLRLLELLGQAAAA